MCHKTCYNPSQTWSSPPPSCRPALLQCTRTFSSGKKIDSACEMPLLSHFDKTGRNSEVSEETYVRKTSRSSPTRPYPRRGDSCISQMALRRQPFPSIPKVNRKSSTYYKYKELQYFLVSKSEILLLHIRKLKLTSAHFNAVETKGKLLRGDRI